MLEAKSRVREHARNISRSSPKSAVAAPSVYVLTGILDGVVLTTRQATSTSTWFPAGTNEEQC